MSDREKFQGLCLTSTNGYQWMSQFDIMPPDVKKRLRESPFNLCAACIAQAPDQDFHRQIDAMEEQLRGPAGKDHPSDRGRPDTGLSQRTPGGA